MLFCCFCPPKCHIDFWLEVVFLCPFLCNPSLSPLRISCLSSFPLLWFFPRWLCALHVPLVVNYIHLTSHASSHVGAPAATKSAQFLIILYFNDQTTLSLPLTSHLLLFPGFWKGWQERPFLHTHSMLVKIKYVKTHGAVLNLRQRHWTIFSYFIFLPYPWCTGTSSMWDSFVL